MTQSKVYQKIGLIWPCVASAGFLHASLCLRDIHRPSAPLISMQMSNRRPATNNQYLHS